MSLLDSARAARQWVERARALIPAEDRKVLLSVPRLLEKFMLFAALHRGAGVHADDLEARDPALVELFMDLFRSVGCRYFHARFSGQENVPREGPVLLVGNHNGGLVTADSFLVGVALFDSQPRGRAMFSLAHDFLFDDPVLRRYAGRLGMLRAGHESAARALRAGHLVLVYPGSEWDAFRPYKDRNRIVLAGRKGFLKLALREQVPIVPVVAEGAHAAFRVLLRGERLARWVGAHRFARVNVMPIVLSFPWGLTSGLVPFIPYPARVSVAFGEPIRFPGLGPEAAEDPEKLDACYREVESRMQAIMDRLVRERHDRA
jgi:1-acyl-sn-glycerol-3-phosphate acyltransferase